MKIFITGVSYGIGEKLAECLVELDHHVWGVARSVESLNSLKQRLGERFSFSVCDVMNKDQMKEVALKMRSQNFIPDVAVLNAGIYQKDTGISLEFQNFEKNFITNVSGSLFWVAEFLLDFLKRGSGNFLAISSTSAYRPGKTSVGYPASKAALSMAFRGLRLNYGNRGIKFTTIHFGPIRTRMWAGSRSPLIPPAEAAAKFIVKTMDKNAGSYFYPFLSTFLFRLILFLPDKVFAQLGKFLKK